MTFLLGDHEVERYIALMARLSFDLPDPLDAKLRERVIISGAPSMEDYLVQSDCDAGDLERVLEDRSGGAFSPLESDWQERVREHASKLAGG